MKEIKLNIPTREDIKPTAKDTAHAISDAAASVPSLATTIVIGGADLATHSVKEIGKGLLSIGSKVKRYHNDRQLKKATEVINKRMDEEQSKAYDERQANTI